MDKWEIKTAIDELVRKGEYAKAIELAEGMLSQLEPTEFHKIIGRDLLPLTASAAGFISDFYQQAKESLDVKSMYLEMNGFGINPDLWFFDPFAYSFCGSPDDERDDSWLADYEFSSEYSFVISGYEDMQLACDDHQKNERYYDRVQSDAKDAFELVVTLRFVQLIAQAVKYAKEHNLPWMNIPVFGTSHDEEILYRPV